MSFTSAQPIPTGETAGPASVRVVSVLVVPFSKVFLSFHNTFTSIFVYASPDNEIWNVAA
jgi:hypothetical protein